VLLQAMFLVVARPVLLQALARAVHWPADFRHTRTTVASLVLLPPKIGCWPPLVLVTPPVGALSVGCVLTVKALAVPAGPKPPFFSFTFALTEYAPSAVTWMTPAFGVEQAHDPSP